MAARIDRAWRFAHPDFDIASTRLGLDVSKTGGIAMVEDAQSVRQSVLLLMTTRPGERVMRPDYGCNLHRLIFEPNDATTQGLAIHYVRQAIERWEPRVEILDLDANANPLDPTEMVVELSYRIRRSGATDTINMPVALT